MAKYNYGKPFHSAVHGRKVVYRYTDKKKSSKTLVDAKTKKTFRMKSNTYK
jgi:hypothetical protein